ncbi:hypothetical protein A0J61_09011 [Choanephora cucurbitarum]|uniref:Uncharacterized protein n=1 Tax=Choanephora cucurbitarum TaxID=101091 RepID=A0A1C7N1H5_9FUNG|nr:hypothetical protein A0J61_09011 [Choanephora cucurbitarum]
MEPTQVHIPFLSQDERICLNTAATYSQARRRSSHLLEQESSRQIEDKQRSRHQHPPLSFLWKRRGSSVSASTTSSAGSAADYTCLDECQSPKAKELESLIFDQPQRTVRMSLTPRYAV